VRKRQAAARKAKKKDDYDPRYLYNGASMQSCKEGGTLLQVVETPIHDLGFWLTASDGSCFDGTMFRQCDMSAAALVWGWGLRFGGKTGESKFLYKWYDSTACLRREKFATSLGDCDASGEWRLSIMGELSSVALQRSSNGEVFSHGKSIRSPDNYPKRVVRDECEISEEVVSVTLTTFFRCHIRYPVRGEL